MQSLSWATLVAELTARGFCYVLHFELSCPDHGDWRSACPVDGEFRPTCPRCGELGSLSVLARGLTKAEISWKLISPALPERWKTETDYEGTYTAAGGGSKSHAQRKQSLRWYARVRKELAGVR